MVLGSITVEEMHTRRVHYGQCENVGLTGVRLTTTNCSRIVKVCSYKDVLTGMVCQAFTIRKLEVLIAEQLYQSSNISKPLKRVECSFSCVSVATVEKGPTYLQLFDMPFTVYLSEYLLY